MNARMECKANKRNDALPSVQFQEPSQIAAWLVQDHRPASAAIEVSIIIYNTSHQEGQKIFLVLVNHPTYCPRSYLQQQRRYTFC
ncbi:hypothetical protein DTO282F9_1589 [Paecilomyces variotii]|nr:hypothetical protein DTO282F9_1589 [Paecilomyces variotii]